jgi:hypothetical protein
MSSWPAHRVTKPWVWYAIMGLFVVAQLAMAALMASFPELRDHAMGPQFLIPGVLIAAFAVLFWRTIAPPRVELRQEDRWLVVDDGRRPRRFDLAGARVGYARWEYPQVGTMGTIVEVASSDDTLRFVVKELLSAERYTLPDSYTYDLHFDDDATGRQVLAAVQRATGGVAPQGPGYRHPANPPTFTIPLRPNTAGAGMLVPILVGSFGMPLVVGLVLVPLSNGVSVSAVLLATLGVLVGAAIAGFLVWRWRENRRYQLRLLPNRIVLEDRHRSEAVAQAHPSQILAVPTYYVLTMRSGSWNIPSVRLTFPGRDEPLTIGGSGVEAAAWMSHATKDRTARHIVGAAEWQALLRALGTA